MLYFKYSPRTSEQINENMDPYDWLMDVIKKAKFFPKISIKLIALIVARRNR